MYLNNFYIPSFDFGDEPDYSGYISDQNDIYKNVYDNQLQNQIDNDLTQQLQNYIVQNQQPIQQVNNNNDSQREYIAINKGDTLSKLAARYNTTVEKLAKLNGIKDINRISAGQTLRLSKNVTNKYVDNIRRRLTARRSRNTVSNTVPNQYRYTQQVPMVSYTPERTSVTAKKNSQRKNTQTVTNRNSIFNIPIKVNSNGQLSAFKSTGNEKIFSWFKKDPRQLKNTPYDANSNTETYVMKNRRRNLFAAAYYLTKIAPKENAKKIQQWNRDHQRQHIR